MRSIIALIFFILANSACAGSISEASEALDRKDYAAALIILTPLAEQGNVDALGDIGNMYAFGWGVEQNLIRAHDYWLKASDKHLATAMYNIATLYFVGKPGFDKDEHKAAEWYKKAAEHRHLQAMLTLSSIYATGRGLPEDKKQAIAWASLSESNAKDSKLKQIAMQQLGQLINGYPKEEFPEIQKIINDLAKKIDSNVNAYRTQSSL